MNRSRLASVRYPPELPITERRDEILEAIRDHQVVIVAGETGSGKSTQLPKMCLELGLGDDGWIGHTQPRRIAARSIAERVSSELGADVGRVVGYKMRFTDNVSKETAIKLMTDGVLLAEMQHDRLLSAYSAIIIDEAHERSLNIDFLLGYLKQLLPRRPDLKVIVTSATIDTVRFSEHFDDAPIVEVSGRTFPVELRHRPLVDVESGVDLTQAEGICEAVLELENEGPGDILVFCSGEREIRDTADALGDLKLRDTEVFPLYARLSSAEQHRVFERSAVAGRRIVVATNVAETSLTVPGIRYVIDPGTARISRYSRRTKVQRLPIEEVSQASADQRAGRCGRIGPGICIRLYSEENYSARPEFTEPEITRTNLASVILQMASLGLGDIEKFPFVEPPELRNIRDGINLLVELDAVDQRHVNTPRWLTPIGRTLARLPIDPRYGRMVIEANETGCLHEVIIITAAMSVQDPRERPLDKREVAGQLHARFDEPGSDFVTWLNLWNHLEAERHARSGNQFRKMCRSEFLNVNRIREWQDIVRQLLRVVRSMKWKASSNRPSNDTIHRAILTGLLSQIGVKDTRSNEFTGGRNARFMIGRSSALSTSPPNWVMAGELMETNRMWAHTVARINPDWAESAGAHVATYSYDEPVWDAEKGSATTIERVSLYGVPLVAGRQVHYRRVDRAEARRLFIHHALIEGKWTTHHAFFEQNEAVLDDVRRLGARQRRDLFVEYQLLYDFFDERVGSKVTSGADFDRWWNRVRKKTPDLLDLRLDDLVAESDIDIDHEAFPEVWDGGGVALDVDYANEPGAIDDGVAVTIPLDVINLVDADTFEWNVPGLREEIVTALLRSMPKDVRKPFVPIPDTVRSIMPLLAEVDGSLVEAVRRALRTVSPAPLPSDALSMERLPDRLRPLFRVVDDTGKALAQGRDFDALRARFAERLRESLADGAHELAATGQTTWTFGTIPRVVETTAASQVVTAHPALVDEGDSVGVQLFPTAEDARVAMWLGTRRLLRLNVGGSARMLNDLLDVRSTLALATGPHGTKVVWVNDVADAIHVRLLTDAGGPVRDADSWAQLVERVRADLPGAVAELGPIAVEILVRNADLRATLAGLTADRLQPAVVDVTAQLDRLVYPGHLSAVGPYRFADVARYLHAMQRRLEKLPNRVVQDLELMNRCRSLEDEFDGYAASLPPSTALEDINWMLEEFRVASFAQEVGTKGKVSEKRIRAALRNL